MVALGIALLPVALLALAQAPALTAGAVLGAAASRLLRAVAARRRADTRAGDPSPATH